MSEETGQNDSAEVQQTTKDTFPSKVHAFKPGQSGNPGGRKTAGAYLKELVNSFYEQDLTADELRKIARDPAIGCRRRTAAERVLRAMEFGDLADFAGLLKGENSLEDLRAMGINTEVVKKFKQKTRVVKGEDNAVEEIVEREIELHDRAGEDFDRICDRTEGKPNASLQVKGDLNLTHKRIILEDGGGSPAA